MPLETNFFDRFGKETSTWPQAGVAVGRVRCFTSAGRVRFPSAGRVRFPSSGRISFTLAGRVCFTSAGRVGRKGRRGCGLIKCDECEGCEGRMCGCVRICQFSEGPF